MKFRLAGTLAFWIFLIVLMVGNEFQAFDDFRTNRPGADLTVFLAERVPEHLLVIAVAAVLLLILICIQRYLPRVDADNTEFHEQRNT